MIAGRPLVWGLLAAAVVVATWPLKAALSNDATQYLNSAAELREGHGFSTSILYFDEHYRFGTLPAPQTVWPPGYPALIAGLAATGMEEETAARLIPKISFVLIFPLLYLLAFRLTGSSVLASLACLWQLGLTEFWMYLTAPNSELPFIAASLAALLLVPDEIGHARRWAGASLCAGIAGWIRYAGVFLLASLALVLVGELLWEWRRRGVLRLQPALWATPGFLMVALLMLRNQLLVGSLQGGNTKVVVQPLSDLLKTTGVAFADVLFGIAKADLAAGPGRVALVGVLALACAAAGAYAVWSPARMVRASFGRPDHRLFLYLSLYTGVYLCGVLATAHRTMLTYGARYLLPVVPVLICLMIYLLARPEAAPPAILGRTSVMPSPAARVAALVALILLAQGAELPRRWKARPNAALASVDPAVAWVKLHTGPNDVIMAIGDGQRIGYQSARPTAVVPQSRFTAFVWDEGRIHRIAREYRVRVFIISRAVREAEYTPFAAELASGRAPAWLHLEVETETGRLYSRLPNDR